MTRGQRQADIRWLLVNSARKRLWTRRAFHWLLFQRLDRRLERDAKLALPVAQALSERFTSELWEKV